jgi:dTDP-4-dehydrorhamnose reductase
VSDLPVVLLLGRTGQVGSEVERLLAGRAALVAPDETVLDLRDEAALRAAVRNAAPAVIVNAAGYTAVDRAESEPEVAHAVNAVAPGILAEEAALLGALFVHYSTDYVFDGAKSAPYVESDIPAPLGEYGRSKLEGERRVLAAGGRGVVLRTSWMYGPRGQNFLLTMLRLFEERDEVRVVDDQVGAPTTAGYIAEATLRVVEAQPAPQSCGLFHATAGGQTSWCGFAARILESDRRPSKKCARVIPIRTSDYPTAARRPAWSVLDCRRFTERFGLVQRPWEELLAETMAEVAGRG